MPAVAILRAEGAALLALAVLAYARLGGEWLPFALLLFVPDVGILGYALGDRAGALAYNALHAMVTPLALAGAGIVLAVPAALLVSLIWLAHIGMDRALGYGLILPAGFRHTHLGSIGRPRG